MYWAGSIYSLEGLVCFLGICLWLHVLRVNASVLSSLVIKYLLGKMQASVVEESVSSGSPLCPGGVGERAATSCPQLPPLPFPPWMSGQLAHGMKGCLWLAQVMSELLSPLILYGYGFVFSSLGNNLIWATFNIKSKYENVQYFCLKDT